MAGLPSSSPPPWCAPRPGTAAPTAALAAASLLLATGCNALWGLDDLRFRRTSGGAAAGGQAGSGGGGGAAGASTGGGGLGGGVAAGEHMWSKRFGDAAAQLGWAVGVDGAGSVVVAGDMEGATDFGGGALASAGANDVFVAKLDKNGGHLWSKRFGDGSDQWARAVAADGPGNVVLAGQFMGSIDFGAGQMNAVKDRDIYVAKLAPDGSALWSKRFGGSENDFAYDVAIGAGGAIGIAGTSDGDVDLGGQVLPKAGDNDVLVIKLDPDGKVLWGRRFGDAKEQKAFRLAIDVAGSLVVTGYLMGAADFGGGWRTSAGGNDAFVVKLTADGDHVWSQRFGDAADQIGCGVAVDAPGNVYLVGDFQGTIDLGGGPLTSAGDADVFVAKLNPGGEHLWSMRAGGPAAQHAARVAVGADGSAVVTGCFGGRLEVAGHKIESAGDVDGFLLRLGPDGSLLGLVGFGDSAAQEGNGLALDANNGDLLLAGDFAGSVDLGGGPLTSAGATDVLLARLRP
ncbi:MAG: hypothetical protein HY744_21770 [Deltaproteobacteria bacterium]|nr:hypothetical protein [Deltaproteobacteria bacterium]